MRVNKHVYASLATGIYITLCIATFDALYDSAQIMSVALVGLFGWLYGSRIGLLLIVPIILLNTVVFLFVSDDIHDILLTYNLAGIIPAIAITLVTGFIHDSNEKLERTKASLSDRVKEATAELEQFTQQLIQRDEEERIRIGRDLHDGVGQWLTGMLLQSESLSLKLKEVEHSETALAEKMTERIRTSMQVIRKLSRSQLPIQPSQMSIETALEEMAAYFKEISSAKISLKRSGNSRDLPIDTIQHLYRIAQEAIHCAIYECRASLMEVTFTAWENTWRMAITATKLRSPDHAPTCLSSSVMKYRVKLIGGILTGKPLPEGGFHLECASDDTEKHA